MTLYSVLQHFPLHLIIPRWQTYMLMLLGSSCLFNRSFNILIQNLIYYTLTSCLHLYNDAKHAPYETLQSPIEQNIDLPAFISCLGTQAVRITSMAAFSSPFSEEPLEQLMSHLLCLIINRSLPLPSF